MFVMESFYLWLCCCLFYHTMILTILTARNKGCTVFSKLLFWGRMCIFIFIFWGRWRGTKTKNICVISLFVKRFAWNANFLHTFTFVSTFVGTDYYIIRCFTVFCCLSLLTLTVAPTFMTYSTGVHSKNECTGSQIWTMFLVWFLDQDICLGRFLSTNINTALASA